MKKGTEVIITGEAVADQQLPSKRAKVVRTFTEPAYGTNPDGSKVPDYELVELEFENGETHTVGLYEVRPFDNVDRVIYLWIDAEEENRKGNDDKCLELKNEFSKEFDKVTPDDKQEIIDYLGSIGA
jgi:hypothetical protein